MAGTILCCVDGSAHCRRAVEVSVDLAKGMNRDLAFVAVNQVRPASGFPPIRAWTEEEAARVLDVAARYAESHGLRKVKRILTESGDIPEAIMDAAREIDADHIVVGTGNPPFIGRLLLGSVSQAVIANAPCSVTVAR